MVTYPIVLALRSAPLLCSRWIWIWIKVIHSDRTRNAAVHDDEDDEDEWCPAEEHTHAAVAGAADRDAQWCFRRIFILLLPRWSGDSSASSSSPLRRATSPLASRPQLLRHAQCTCSVTPVWVVMFVCFLTMSWIFLVHSHKHWSWSSAHL